MPGLIDAHVHVDLIGHGDYERFYEFMGGMERINDVMPIGAKQMLRAGVTSGIDLGAPFRPRPRPMPKFSASHMSWVRSRRASLPT